MQPAGDRGGSRCYGNDSAVVAPRVGQAARSRAVTRPAADVAAAHGDVARRPNAPHRRPGRPMTAPLTVVDTREPVARKKHSTCADTSARCSYRLVAIRARASGAGFNPGNKLSATETNS